MHICLRSKKAFPAWSFANYVGTTTSHYTKLLQIRRLLSAIGQGAPDDDFFVATYSSALYPVGEFAQPGNLIKLAEKGRSAKEFWEYVRKLKRPIIFKRSRRGEHVLYEPDDKDALKILTASLASPFEVNFNGVDAILRQLFYGRRDERRRQELHEVELERQELELQRERIRVAREALAFAQEVENENLTPTLKASALATIFDVSERQKALDQRATIEVKEEE